MSDTPPARQHAPPSPVIARDRRPLGVQVYDAIREQIRRGEYPPGARLPSETALATEHGVSRVTVREALRLLQREHRIRSVHGRGHYVLDTSKLVETELTELRSVTELMHGLGLQVETTVISMLEERAAHHAALLDVSEDDPVVRLERARRSDGVPMIYSVDVFPPHLVEGSEAELRVGGSLLTAFARHGVEVAYSKATVSAAELPRQAAKSGGFPKLLYVLMEQVNYTPDQQPVLYSLDYHRGDKFTFTVLRTRTRR